MNPLISVVIATFRREKELEKALESLANQTYNHYELILVDDNDDPHWNGIVRRVTDDLRRAHPDIRLTCIENHPNRGSAATRNIGISASGGTYVTFLDDDDVYLPSKIEAQTAFMEEGGFDYSITDLYLYNECGKLVDRRVRDYIKVGDEYYLMHRAIECGGKFGYLPRCDVKAYVHTGEGGLSSGDGKIEGERMLYEYKKQYFSKICRADRRYIKMRHHAVIAYAELRRRRLPAFALNAAKAVLTSPEQIMSILKP